MLNIILSFKAIMLTYIVDNIFIFLKYLLLIIPIPNVLSIQMMS